ncbi:MAG: IclR family transcriptional regulator [Nostocoides sp.]
MRSTERDGVLDRTMALLDAFDADAPRLSLAELTRRCGLPKSTVHRLAADLVAARLLDRDGGSGRYQLGLRLFELGELVPQHRSLRDAALPVMEDLREATRQRIHLAVLDGVDVVYVAILGASSVHVDSRPGGRLPAHATGVGQALLAYAPPSVVTARIEAGLDRLTPRTITTPGALIRTLAAVRAEGTAYDREESTIGVCCVAAPVFGTGNQIRAALSVTGPTTSIDPDRLGVAVRTAAFTLTRTLRTSAL